MTEEAPKASTAAPAFTAEDALAFMQKMWNPFGMPMPGSASGAVEAAPDAKPDAGAAWNPAAMFAALDPREIERRIADLRVIEGWLAMSLGITQTSIRALELQRTSLEALQAANAPPKPKRPARRKT